MDIAGAVRIAKERIVLNNLRQEDIDNPIRAEFIRETTEALQLLVDYAGGERSETAGWIGVDELPGEDGYYLTWYISEYGKGAVVQYYNRLNKNWGMMAMFGGEVTHWCSLPEAPEGMDNE